MGFFLAPSPRWSASKQTGFAAAGGLLYTYVVNSRDPKATFGDVAGTIENDNPTRLDSAGERIIYWNNDVLYYIELYDSNNNLIYTQNGYPVVDAGGGDNTINIFNNRPNFVRNAQFNFWANGRILTNPASGDVIADDWLFYRNNENATIKIQQVDVSVTDATWTQNNTRNVLQYECTNVGSAGETEKYIQQNYQSVFTFANKEVFFSFKASCVDAVTISVQFQQYFGSGGSPSPNVIINVLTQALTSTATAYTATVTLPSIASKTLGTDGNDYLALIITFPLNTLVSQLNISDVSFNKGNTSVEFDYLSYETQFQNLVTRINDAVFFTGFHILTLDTASRPGWVLANDGTIGNAASGSTTIGIKTKALFTLVWTNTDITLCPIFDSAGAASTKGASALDDWNANKRISLTRALGRALAVAGAGSGLTSRALAQFIGEEGTVITVPQLPSHTHNYTSPQAISFFPGGLGQPGTVIIPSQVNPTTATGNNEAHNTMQPTLFLNCLIKL